MLEKHWVREHKRVARAARVFRLARGTFPGPHSNSGSDCWTRTPTRRALRLLSSVSQQANEQPLSARYTIAALTKTLATALATTAALVTSARARHACAGATPVAAHERRSGPHMTRPAIARTWRPPLQSHAQDRVGHMRTLSRQLLEHFAVQQVVGSDVFWQFNGKLSVGVRQSTSYGYEYWTTIWVTSTIWVVFTCLVNTHNIKYCQNVRLPET